MESSPGTDGEAGPGRPSEPARAQRPGLGFGRLLLRVLVSLLIGGAAYTVWLAVFLLARPAPGSMTGLALWLLAPVTTAAGFTAGLALLERPWEGTPFPLLSTLLACLAGCMIGAAPAFALGPMVTVFGMLLGGALSVVALETRRTRR